MEKSATLLKLTGMIELVSTVREKYLGSRIPKFEQIYLKRKQIHNLATPVRSHLSFENDTSVVEQDKRATLTS